MIRQKASPTHLIIILVLTLSITLPGCSYTSLADHYEGSLATSPSSNVDTGSSDATPVFVSVVIHFEESFPQDTEYFAEARQQLLDFARFCNSHRITYNFQPDWAFMAAMGKYETQDMRDQTNNKNILQYLAEDMKQEIDPHSHEHEYNYADVAYLISSFGVTPSSIGGGLISYPADKCQLDRFLVPFEGQVYDYTWQADYIWGGGTPNHVQEPVVSGIWWPKDSAHYYENLDGASIPAIGKYTGEIKDIYRLVDKIQRGELPGDQCYTAAIMVNQPDILKDMAEMDQEMETLMELQNQGRIRFVSLQELINTWETDFGSRGYLYNEGSQDLGKKNDKSTGENNKKQGLDSGKTRGKPNRDSLPGDKPARNRDRVDEPSYRK